MFLLSSTSIVTNMWWLQNVPSITLFLRNTKQYKNLSYISFTVVPLCNNTLMPVTVKMLETFLKAIL